MITNATKEQLNQALKTINKRYDGNVEFNRFDIVSKNRIAFTLRVKHSHGKGSRYGQSGLMGMGTKRHLISACWHVHGYYFEALLAVNPDAFVKTHGRTMDKNGGNWIDWNIGSMVHPVSYSSACDCSEWRID